MKKHLLTKWKKSLMQQTHLLLTSLIKKSNYLQKRKVNATYLTHVFSHSSIHMSVLFSQSLKATTTIPNTLQQPAALDINTKRHISLILSDGDVLVTSKKKSFWPSVRPLLLITAQNTRHIKTPNLLESFYFKLDNSSIQFPTVSWEQLNEPWKGISTVPINGCGR